MTSDEAIRIVRELAQKAKTTPAAAEALGRLLGKAKWEAMSLAAVVREWGDPREWK